MTPLFVQRDDQVQGLVHLLSLGLRILTLIEFVIRRQLAVTGGVASGTASRKSSAGNDSTHDREVVEGGGQFDIDHPGGSRTVVWTCVSLESTPRKDFEVLRIVPGNLFCNGRVFWIVGEGTSNSWRSTSTMSMLVVG